VESPRPHPLLWLDELQWSDQTQTGSKILILSQLRRRGYPVPSGFVISAACLEWFLEQVHCPEALFTDFPHSALRVSTEEPYQLQQIAQKLQQVLMAQPLLTEWLDRWEQEIQTFQESHVILRPCLISPSLQTLPLRDRSREAALPPHLLDESIKTTGILEAKICAKNIGSFATALKQLWVSLFQAKSLIYWQSLGIDLPFLRMAVLVQPLQAAFAAGTLQIRPHEILVEATRGLGLAITQGDVIPDRYRFDCQGEVLLHQQLGHKLIAYGYPLNDPPVEPGKESLAEAKGFSFRWLSTAEQEHYALNTQQVNSLVQQALTLVPELASSLSLEWILLPSASEPSGESSPQFLWLQVDPHPDASDPTKSLLPAPSPHLQGEVAAPGFAVGPVLQWSASQTPLDAQTLKPGSIFMGRSLPPALIPVLHHLGGLVLEEGGLTSHGAILARELQIPALVGVAKATQSFYPGEWVTVDGNRGTVYKASFLGETPLRIREETKPEPHNTPPLQGDNVTATQIWVTVSHPATLTHLRHLIQAAGQWPVVDGIGLLRAEWLFLDLLDNRHPRLWIAQGQGKELVSLMVKRLQDCLETIRPYPLFYRCCDFRAREFQALQGTGEEPERNSGLQSDLDLPRSDMWKRSNLSPAEPEIFALELQMLQQVRRLGGDLRLVLPWVRTVEQFLDYRHQIEAAGLLTTNPIPLWIMAEAPSVLFLLPDYAQSGVQGLAIGSNDLAQFLLGGDRDLGGYRLDHPAVQQAILQIITQANALKIPCSLCGQLPIVNPNLVKDWVAAGITALSVEIGSVPFLRYRVAQAERQLLLLAARQQLSSN
jgi:pyruvate,water dikinase